MARRQRDRWIARVKAVELEHQVAALAVDRLREAARTDPTVLPTGVQPRDVRDTIGRLEATYFVRLYAVFEAGLRDAWRFGLGRNTQPLMRDLLDGIASAWKVDPAALRAAHRVREFRNGLVHEQADGPAEAVTIGDGRRHLTRFFAHLPPNW